MNYKTNELTNTELIYNTDGTIDVTIVSTLRQTNIATGESRSNVIKDSKSFSNDDDFARCGTAFFMSHYGRVSDMLGKLGDLVDIM